MANIQEDRVRRIEELVRQMEAIPDRASRETAKALMEAVLQLHGDGIERMMDIVFDAGDTGRAAIRRFAGDNLIASLLVLHGLHPDDMETRVQQALAKIGGAELLGIFEGVVRVRVTSGGCGTKESVAATLRNAVPDAADVLVEEGAAPTGFVPLSSLVTAVPGSA